MVSVDGIVHVGTTCFCLGDGETPELKQVLEQLPSDSWLQRIVTGDLASLN